MSFGKASSCGVAKNKNKICVAGRANRVLCEMKHLSNFYDITEFSFHLHHCVRTETNPVLLQVLRGHGLRSWLNEINIADDLYLQHDVGIYLLLFLASFS
jgi:hypothetical protein